MGALRCLGKDGLARFVFSGPLNPDYIMQRTGQLMTIQMLHLGERFIAFCTGDPIR